MALIAVIASWISAPVASAGGSTFESDRERYEPGDDVTLVGDTGGGAYGWIEDGPFFGYLERLGPDDLPIEGSRLHVGQMEVTETGKGGWQTLARDEQVHAAGEPGTRRLPVRLLQRQLQREAGRSHPRHRVRRRRPA